MTNLYYTPASGSTLSSLTVLSDSAFISASSYINVSLEISASKYLISGSSNYLDYTRVYIKSGSTEFASFPLDETNIIYTGETLETIPPPSPTPVTESITPYIYVDLIYQSDTRTTPLTSSLRIVSGSTTVYSSSFNKDQSIFTLLGTEDYSIILSGSGNYYNSSIAIYDTQNTIPITYVTSSNTPITASILSSIYYLTTSSYKVVAQSQQLPYIKIEYDSIGNIPVSPTNSLAEWNNYLSVTASLIETSGSTVYVVGEDILNATTTTLVASTTHVTNFSTFGLTNLNYLFLSGPGKLNQFPTAYNSTNLQLIEFSSNQISSSIANFTSSQNLETIIGSNNYISGNINGFLSSLPTSSISNINISSNQLTGSVPNLSSFYNLQYFNCSNNKISGSIDLKECYTMQYYDISNNQLSGSLLDITSSCGNLQYFDCGNNHLTGSIPHFTSSLYSLTDFRCNNNKFTGSIPYSSGTQLIIFVGNDNQFTTYQKNNASGYIEYFNAANNLLDASSVDDILADLDISNIVSGAVLLNGTGNSVPSATGLAYSASLAAKGWLVNVNQTPPPTTTTTTTSTTTTTTTATPYYSFILSGDVDCSKACAFTYPATYYSTSPTLGNGVTLLVSAGGSPVSSGYYSDGISDCYTVNGSGVITNVASCGF